MPDMRRLIALVEGVQRVLEIERGGGVDTSDFDAMRSENDFTSPQHDLFADIPTLEPHLPNGYEQVGRIGTYVVARKEHSKSSSGEGEYTYYLFDRNTPFAYTVLYDPSSNYGNGYKFREPELSGKGLRTCSVYVDRSHHGQGIALKLYHWVLSNVCDYLLTDDMHTSGGEATWRKMLNSRRFEVMVFDPRTMTSRRRRPGKDFEQVYQNHHLRAFVTLAGKASTLIPTGDDY